MKKTVSILILLMFCSLFVTGCSKCGSVSKYEKMISEYRSDVYSGENEHYSVSMCTGYRETAFEIDGKCGDKSNYTLVTLTPKSDSGDKSIEIVVRADGAEYSGSALKHPYKNSFSFEYMEKTQAKSVEIDVGDGNGKETIMLASVRKEGEIEGMEALDKAAKQLNEALEPYGGADGFEGEIYVRYIENPIKEDGKYFWYIAFVPASDADKSIAALIDVVTGEIKASRK